MTETLCTQVTDMLFIGNEEMAYDSMFLKQNDIAHIVNLSGKEVANIFQKESLKDPYV